MTLDLTDPAIKALLADPKWRLNNLYWFVDAYGNERPFRMNEQQEHFYDRLWYWNLILKARQVGWTTLIALMALDQCLFNDNYSACIIAHKVDDAVKIFEGKIKFAYNRLPPDLKAQKPLVKEPAGELWFKNGSKCIVDTSARSGTLQFLHISEYGKICAQRPDVAKEIKSGSFPAVAPGNFVFVESTAEGTEGDFFDLTMAAKAKAEAGKQLTSVDFRLHFYGWYTRADNVLPPHEVPMVTITREWQDYFTKSETETGITYSAAQKAWYVKTEEKLTDTMKRENPATIKEAFEASVEGIIYGRQLTIMRLNRQITAVPWQPDQRVNTFWDLGRSKGNAMAVWCHQRVGMRNCLIRYHEAEGEGVAYFAKYLNRWGYNFAVHYLPHDGDNHQDGEIVRTRADILRGLIDGDVVVGDRIRELDDGIEATREFLPSCWIDEENCAKGLKSLENYKRRFNTTLKQFMTEPLHNGASNGADALRTGAQTYVTPSHVDPTASTRKRRRPDHWRA